MQSILITASIIGRLKAWIYVLWVALFSSLSGLLYGFRVDGTHPAILFLILAAILGFLATGFRFYSHKTIKYPGRNQNNFSRQLNIAWRIKLDENLSILDNQKRFSLFNSN